MPINPKKVLLIVNADVQASRDAADWYATVRGLRSTTLNGVNNEYHRLAVNFGTTVGQGYWLGAYLAANFAVQKNAANVVPFTNDGANNLNTLTVLNTPSSTYNYSALGLMDAVGQYCLDHAIECVLLSILCPNSVHPGSGLAYSLPWLLGIAKEARILGGWTSTNYTNIRNWVNATTRVNTSGAFTSAAHSQNTPSPHWLKIYNVPFDYGGGGDVSKGVTSKLLPFGRLGLPDYQNLNISTSAIDTVARLQTIVNGALAAEATVNHAKAVCVGLTSYGDYAQAMWGGGASHMRAAYYEFLRLGFTNLKTFRQSAAYVGSGYLTVGYSYNEPVTEGNETFPNYPTFLAGGYNSPTTQLFGFIHSQPANYWTGTQGGNPAPAAYATHPMWNNFTVLPGAWGLGWQSMAYHTGADILLLGGSAALITDGEPGDVSALWSSADFARAIALGTTFAEAIYAANFHTFIERQFPIGDPLYAPYKRTVGNNARFY